MTTLPHLLYRGAQARALDHTAIHTFAIPGSVLMERAGGAAFQVIRQCWPQAARLGVVCGTGNNGGDGFVLARLAGEAGLQVRVWQVGDAEHVHGDALAACQRLQGTGISPQPWSADSGRDLAQHDVLVDALLGTGLSGAVRGVWATVITALNASAVPILALDIPSGLDADTGRVLGTSVHARACVSFIGLKPGLLTGAGPEHVGALYFNDLQVPDGVYARQPAAAHRLDFDRLAPLLGRRPRDAHKGYYGHVLIVGGGHGMSGAPRLAGEAAARVGAGLVSIATRTAHAALLSVSRPELMAHGVDSAADLAPLLARASVVAVGPGLGQDAWARALFARVLEAKCPLVVDADALTLLGADPLHRDDWVLTPHPGEAGRLLGLSAGEVQADRFAALDTLVSRYGGVCVLKGSGTLVHTPVAAGPAVGICTAGNPGMASGGMGDVLSGVIAGLMAQGLAPAEAASLGVCLHARAADEAARVGERGLLASDLMPWLRRLANAGG